MAKQVIDISTANSGQGTPLRSAFDMINDNFTELYTDDAGDVNSITATAPIARDSATGDVTISLTDGGISTQKIADDAVTADKLANSINTTIADLQTDKYNKTGGTISGNALINNASNPTLLQIGSNLTDDPFIVFQTDGNTMSTGIDRGDSNKFKISDNATLGTNDRLTIDTSGNVGIGTSSPLSKLHLSTGADSNAGNIELVIGGTSGANARTGRIIKNTSSPYEMTIRASDFGSGSNLILNDTGGNVGIGISTIASGGTNTQNVQIHNSTANSTYLKLSTAGTGATAGDGTDLIVGNNGEAYLWNRENASTIFATNNTPRMTITAAGGISFGNSNTAYGTLGQVLKSNVDAPPTWSEAIPDGSVTTAKIADSNITVGKMAVNSVDSDQYVDASIDTAHFALDAAINVNVDQNSGTLKLWSGSQAQYDALTPDASTIYFIV